MKKVLLLIPLLVALVSCSKEVDTTQGDAFKTVTFTANAPQTKTALGEKNGTSWPVLWSSGDVISVNGVKSRLLEDAAAGRPSAEFTVLGVSAPFYAASPASAISGYSNGTATVTIPSNQTYNEGSFDPAAYVMLATSDEENFAFLPQVALFSITPTGESGHLITSVRLSSNGNVPLSGAFTTDWNGMTAGEGSSPWVKMVHPVGVDLGKPWVLAIAPADLKQDGLEVVITDSEGGVMTRHAKPSKAYETGRLYTATIPYSSDLFVPVTGIVLDPNALAFTEIGETIQVTATILPIDATDKSFAWSVDDPTVVSIDEDGVVTALASGNTYIHATASNGVVGSAEVRVSLSLSTPYTEDFESYDNESIRSDWFFIDADGDGFGWQHNLPDYNTFACHSGAGALASASYINAYGPLTPDNWAFTPAIKLKESDNVLSFWMAPMDAGYPEEHYAVYISTEVSTESCIRLVEGTLTQGTSYIYGEPSTTGAPAGGQYKPMTVGTWEHFTVDIPEEFNGKVVHIAFRHYSCTDYFWLNLDDISITSKPQESPGDPDPDEPTPASCSPQHASLVRRIERY